ncbi:lon protease homolog 2, peroxisomal isoform X1 [Corythoichthys intestinalis]|uniref:lon protease homolog 2, peroxisomal isoform X1 n=2 Tax=Corythoichthys intestinalis TaxID=161448 RepID=UPI0025A4FB78|nr:lon protease homolog 2, peroxisomal isoform X1 [Corythoichthys intestinalis]
MDGPAGKKRKTVAHGRHLPEWERQTGEYAGWIKASLKGQRYSFCVPCGMSIEVSASGFCDLSKHFETKGHQDAVSRMKSYAVTKAEVLFCQFVAEHNLPATIADHFSELTKEMFPDSEIASVLSVRKGAGFSDQHFNLNKEEADEDGDEDGDDTASLRWKVHAAKMPDEALRVCLKELKRLKKMSQSMPEYARTRNYLDLMIELPWSNNTKDSLDIQAARTLLDNDHYAMEKLKRRVLEYLAVRQLKDSLKDPILCFVGPPGVGKTSVGRSIAKCLRREFHCIALAGVCDQSDIRGHRRTYVGSMPGRIINGLKTVAVNNPVFLLDEVDKLGMSWQGDPAAALLEVLDPEQNHSFTDHYLNVTFDLSQVLFIATANTTATIPTALLDRMEVVWVPGYTQEEKLEISNRHLIPHQLEHHGLSPQQLRIPPKTTNDIINRYTREAGVRSLERNIGAVCRAVAVKIAEVKAASPKLAMPIVIKNRDLKDILGIPFCDREVSERLTLPGVALGLVWTYLGGEILFVEASRTEGEGKLTLTGQLGNVMKESAHLAISWLRANSKHYKLTNMTGGSDPMEGTDIHLHFPTGAVTKNGPSAGVTIVTCLASLFSGRLVRSDVAMTGEITLRGSVLPVGCIKDKVLAAHRAGVKRVILPRRNEKDLDELPLKVRYDLDFVTADDLDQVLNAAFDGGFPGKEKKQEAKQQIKQ